MALLLALSFTIPANAHPVASAPVVAWTNSSLAGRGPTAGPQRAARVARLLQTAAHWLGTSYVFGGTTSKGFDCSGYVMTVFGKNGIVLPRMADEQYHQGRKVANPSPGDLVFFSTYLPGPSHVGIYLGNDRFMHASSRLGVTISSLSSGYYKQTYIGARSYI